METNRHNYGLDLYRILCCIGVLTYHIMDDVLGKSDGGGPISYILQPHTVSRVSFCWQDFCWDGIKQ